MADAQANVTVNVKGNVGDLDAKLKKQEAAIKTLDGAINLLGGGVELLAGGLALSGAVSEEQAKAFETAAIGAIAFADGAKRTLDGVKSLNEGLKTFGGVAGVAKKAQLALNKAVLANPYIAVAVGLAVLTAAIVVYVNSLETEEEAQRAASAARAEALGQQADEADLNVRLAKARGENTISIKEQEIAARALRAEQTGAAAQAEEDLEKSNELFDKQLKLLDDNTVARAELRSMRTKAAEDETAKEATEIGKQQTQREKDTQAIWDEENRRNQGLIAEKIAFDDEIKRLNDEKRQRAKDNAQAIEDYEHDLLMEEFNNDIARLKSNQATGEAEVKNDEAVAAFKQGIQQQTIDNFQGALTALFGESKEIASANVLIDAAQAAVGIINSSQKFKDPTGTLAIAYQISQFALLAATTVKSLQTINSAQPGSTNSPSYPKPTAPNVGGVGISYGAPTLGIGGTTPGGRTQPIEAYVVSGTVTNAQQADAQLRRRRTLGG